MPSLDTSSDDRRDAAVQTLTDPSNERQVEEIATRSATSDIDRDEELWFEDGDLAIVALSGNVEFRVYQELLLVHSPTLREMLSAQNPTAESTQLSHVDEGDCVTLRLVGMIHPTYDELSAQIRLGHKYRVKQMVQSGVDYLQVYFPETTSRLKNWEIKDRFKPPGFELHHAIGVVNLARLTGTHSLLPAALMACASLGRELTKGFTRPDGTQEALASNDLVRCIAGRTAWMKATATASHKVFQRAIASDCKRRAKCKPVFDKILERLSDAESALFDVTFRTPSSWTSHVDTSDTDRVLCPRCYAMIGVWGSGRQVEQAQELLRRISEIFGLAASDGHDYYTEAKVLGQMSVDAS
ncbi:hypothetical protein C8T65DRAFT_740574 [Cerioporus squamosus]|nr:hypothetical protein C8T65DRAFT_740574 [Cerioporus squamosus]